MIIKSMKKNVISKNLLLMILTILTIFSSFPFSIYAAEVETTTSAESSGDVWIDFTEDVKNLLLTSCGIILDTESNIYSSLSESIDTYLVSIGYKSANTLKVHSNNGNISFDSALIQSLRNYMKTYNSDIYYLNPTSGDLEDGFNVLFTYPSFTVDMAETMVNNNSGVIFSNFAHYISLNDFSFAYIDNDGYIRFCNYNLATVYPVYHCISGDLVSDFYISPDFVNNTYNYSAGGNVFSYGLELKVYSSLGAISSERLNPNYYITTNAPDQRSYDLRTYTNFNNTKYQTFYNNTDNSITDLGTYNYYTYNSTVSTSFESTLNELLESTENIENNTNQIIQQLNDVIELLREHSSFLENIDNTTSDIKGLVTALVGLEIVDLLEDLADDIFFDTQDYNTKIMPLIKTRFPFSLPWDVLAILNLLRAEPEIPSFTIHLYIKSINFGVTKNVNFENFSYISSVSRTFFSLTFCIALILKTKKFL